MAEVGLLAFADTARKVGQPVLRAYRTRFSKHQFTQFQLLAIFCLIRYDDWTFCERDVRLNERRDLCRALGLNSVPDFTMLFRQRHTGQAREGAVGATAGVGLRRPLTRPITRSTCRSTKPCCPG